MQRIYFCVEYNSTDDTCRISIKQNKIQVFKKTFKMSARYVDHNGTGGLGADGMFLSTLNLTGTDSGQAGGDGTDIPFKMLSNHPEAFVVPIIFTLIFIIGMIGNGTLIFTVLRNKNMRNTPNIFIVSLALGDLLLIFVSVPFTATIYTFNGWTYGSAMCKLNEFLQALSLGISVFTLVALSGDRYVAIVYPMSKHKGNHMLRTMLIAAAIWIFSLSLATLEGVSAHLVTHRYNMQTFQVCVVYPVHWGKWYPKFHVMFRFIVYFAMPIFIIATFYTSMARILVLSGQRMPGEAPRMASGVKGPATKQLEARKKVAKLVLSFVIVFMACWLPRHIYLLWFHYDPGTFNMFWHVFKIMGFCLSFINSCVNPLALYFLSRQFRRYYDRYLCCCCRRDRGHREGGHEYSEASKMYNFNSKRNSTSMTEMTTHIVSENTKSLSHRPY